jgi:autoinducer 2-degrading protein
LTERAAGVGERLAIARGFLNLLHKVCSLFPGRLDSQFFQNGGAAMYVVCVTVWVKEGDEDEFVLATLYNARCTRQEPGNRRFDVLRHEEEPGRFLLYEVYDSPDDFQAHQQTTHYLKWRDTVADWMAQKRQGIKHVSLFPEDENDW